VVPRPPVRLHCRLRGSFFKEGRRGASAIARMLLLAQTISHFFGVIPQYKLPGVTAPSWKLGYSSVVVLCFFLFFNRSEPDLKKREKRIILHRQGIRGRQPAGRFYFGGALGGQGPLARREPMKAERRRPGLRSATCGEGRIHAHVPRALDMVENPRRPQVAAMASMLIGMGGRTPRGRKSQTEGELPPNQPAPRRMLCRRPPAREFTTRQRHDLFDRVAEPFRGRSGDARCFQRTESPLYLLSFHGHCTGNSFAIQRANRSRQLERPQAVFFFCGFVSPGRNA